jgi:hypothetical protein
MGLQWPDEPQPTRRRRQRATRFQPEAMVGTREIFDSDEQTGQSSRLQFWVPTLVFILILLALGVLLVVLGPLPTIFPRVDCGWCEIRT